MYVSSETLHDLKSDVVAFSSNDLTALSRRRTYSYIVTEVAL